MKEIIAYRQGGIWIANVGCYIITLHYTHQTKKSVIEWAEENTLDILLLSHNFKRLPIVVGVFYLSAVNGFRVYFLIVT